MKIVKEFLQSVWTLNTEQIAIISLLITFLLFVLGKYYENRIKVYETRKAEYQKLIDFIQKIFSTTEADADKLANDIALKKEFLGMGASLAIYGSKKLYKTYCFYRWLALDENLHQNRWYSKDMLIYSLGEMYQIMRREIGLNHELIRIDVPDILAFYINDFTKPEFKKKFYIYHFNKYALKSAIFWGKIEEFIPLIWFQNYIIKPLFLLLFCIIRFPIKLLIFTPLKFIKKHVIESKNK